MALQLSNNATSTLATTITAVETSLSVQAPDASRFPLITAGDWFPITVVDPSGNLEIMRCTARAGAALTVVRAQEGTAALPFTAGARVDLRFTKSAIDAVIGAGALDAFSKADPSAVAFTKTGAGTLQIKAGTKVQVATNLYTFAAATSVTMPTLAAGTDYAIWIKPDGTLQATADFVSPPAAGSRKIGGFHYAPGGNAAARAGGNTTPGINEYSLWDVKFRPACPDPRGMALVAGSFWVDIYLLGVNHHTDGSSKYNVTIADGASPPKIPTAFGGNGSAIYGSLNWWEAAEVLESHGKQQLDYAEFAAMAFGATEEVNAGTDPVSTILRAVHTSKWGVMLATGNLWVWGRDFGGDHLVSGYVANTVGRGSTSMLSNASLFGGHWYHDAPSGSRASYWYDSPPNSVSHIGARGRCDHLNHV